MLECTWNEAEHKCEGSFCLHMNDEIPEYCTPLSADSESSVSTVVIVVISVSVVAIIAISVGVFLFRRKSSSTPLDTQPNDMQLTEGSSPRTLPQM